jgi:cytidylate kinase
MKKIVIAIDGHAACGKSTSAKLLAKKLNYIFIDSGAMYRAVTLHLLKKNIDPDNTNQVLEALKEIDVEFRLNKENGQNDVYLNNVIVSHEIRSMHVNDHVSTISSIKEVRQFLVAKQQEIGKKKGIVMDGRDIGTVVFPNASLKIFMTASIEARAGRRLAELQEKGIVASEDEIIKNLRDRDHKDSTRRESPLRKADDAIIVDTSTLTIEEQINKLLALAKKAMAEK